MARAEVAVLIPSCDAYADLWRPFFMLFSRYWPDCPYPVYLGANHKSYQGNRVTTVSAPSDRNWSRCMRQYLGQIPSDYVICMLEDFFLQRQIEQTDIQYAFGALRSLDGTMLRLIPNPPPDRAVRGWTNLGVCEPGRPYRVSLQGALWHRERLLSLLCDGENAWQFEEGASRRSGNSSGYYCVYRPVLTYRHHVVERGKWFRNEAKRFGAMNIGCDFTKRAVMSAREMAAWRYRKAIGQCRDAIPWRWRRVLKRLTVRS